MVVQVGHVNGSGGVHADPYRSAEHGGRGRAAVAAEAGRAGSRDGGDDAARIDAPDALIQHICDIKISGRIHGHALWRAQLRAGGLTAVAAVSPLAADSGHRGDDPVGDHADRGVACVGDVHVAE